MVFAILAALPTLLGMTVKDHKLVFPLVLACVLAFSAEVRAVEISLWPNSLSLRAGSQYPFQFYVWRSIDKSLIWSVNGVRGGDALLGTITADGVYTAPELPPPTTVILTATSVANPAVSTSAAITVLNPLPTISSVTPATIRPGPFTAIIDGAGFVPASTARVAGASLVTTYISPTRLSVTGTARLVPGGLAAVTVANPEPGAAVSAAVAMEVDPPADGVSARAAVRFLEQISWGPDPDSIARVRAIGFDAYLEEQFAMPPSSYPDYAATIRTLEPVQKRFLANAMTGPDQLRQRVSFALMQILVVSGLKVHTPEQFVPYVRLLHNHAFSDWETVLREVTLSPSMGRFLDMVYSEKANPYLGSSPNENYARELLQLFTIGTERLNLDGTPLLDDTGNGVPTFDQNVVEGFARALTGWTYPTKPGATPQLRNPPNFEGRMEPVAHTHDAGEKLLLDGTVLPAGQTAEQDLAGVLANIMAHPNVAPFLARRLIQHLVTSNPSAAYVSRVAAAFNGGGTGSRGDLKAIVRAIVLDPDARQGDSDAGWNPGAGHLREPLLYVLALLRGLGATLDEVNNLPAIVSPAGQILFYPPSVFSYFSPDHHILPSGPRAPEFELHTPSAALYRASLALLFAFAPQSAGITIDLEPFEQLASEPALLVEALNRALLAGRMPHDVRQVIETNVADMTPSYRARLALFLVASSSHYQVQY
jgi:uncharacterized protein (DUF1800 family)